LQFETVELDFKRGSLFWRTLLLFVRFSMNKPPAMQVVGLTYSLDIVKEEASDVKIDVDWQPHQKTKKASKWTRIV